MKAAIFAMLFAGGLANAETPVIDEGIGKARKLIHEVDGWQAFRARNGSFYSCFAFKLAEGETAFMFPPTGSAMANGIIGGRRGLKIYIEDSSEQFEYGLFGKEVYPGTAALEANGKIYTAVYSFGDLKLAPLLQLDGARAEVEITSYQYRSRIGRSDRYSGRIDFTGLRSAHEALVECHGTKASI